MAKEINNIIYDDYEFGVPTVLVDFSNGEGMYVGTLENAIPEREKFDVRVRYSSFDKESKITGIELINIEDFLKQDGFKYLPDLGQFEYKNFTGSIKDIIYHELLKNNVIKFPSHESDNELLEM